MREHKIWKISAVILAIFIIIAAAGSVILLAQNGKTKEESVSKEPEQAKLETLMPDKKETKVKKEILIKTDSASEEAKEESGKEDSEEKVQEQSTSEEAEQNTGEQEEPGQSTQDTGIQDDGETTPDRAEILNQVDVESEVLRIRAIYTEIQNNVSSYSGQSVSTGECYISPDGVYQKRIIPAGTEGMGYAREYYYENNKLIFAFYYEGTTEERFYFCNEVMFRWIDENRTTYDKAADDTNWQNWEATVLNEGRSVVY